MKIPSASGSTAIGFYESDQVLSEYLLMHFGSERQIFAGLPGPLEALWFPQKVVRALLHVDPQSRFERALDVGCAVGGSSFELSKLCKKVVGIDSSQAFIHAAQELKKNRSHAVHLRCEGDICVDDQTDLPADVMPERVTFCVGDAMALDSDLQNFDVVLAANLICRLPDPTVFLERAGELVRPGGQLLLTSPFTWLESFTPRSAWLGGGKNGVRSINAIQQILAPAFSLELVVDLPFLIREHARKFQYGVACGMRWRKNKG